MKIKNIIQILFAFSPLLIILPVFAKASLEIDGDKPLKDKEIKSGFIKVRVSYQPNNLAQDTNGDSIENLSYKIYYKDVLYVNDKAYNMFAPVGIDLQDLDNNGTDEVIIRTFSGGAHCCTSYYIYTWQNNKFNKIDTGFIDGEGGVFEDLNNDKKIEFITSDNSFLYQFSSYAGSYPPTLIYQFDDGKFIDVTRNHPKLLIERLQDMYQAYLTAKKEDYERNGVLSGYVAQKILLGEYESGWKFMLSNYDRSSDWGLDIYKGENIVGKHPDFPTALKVFLIERGYLDKNGNPKK
ncbi:hypothetical protein C7H19_05100 [Aphanothece hegewaldii CCALA 016]|uniref:VCBS repeat-containing protein n=1 Tax=Aphanothece hegewaldii CCALA 016 TaxID=2107694 RepID=A0A2T1M104_9CHRO|nr:hypothetical protein [Aphanothece hegewaldii]PSF38370.1 hypothetical protein C7H19_05100 [Aphanothece hegewaldii CCALA 016]